MGTITVCNQYVNCKGRSNNANFNRVKVLIQADIKIGLFPGQSLSMVLKKLTAKPDMQ